MKKKEMHIWIILILALAFRLILLLWRRVAFFDEGHYLNLAATLLSGNWKGALHPYWPPGFPMLAAFSGLIFRNVAFAGRAVNILLSVSTILPVYLLAVRITGRKAALLAAFFVALYPPLAFLHTSALADPALTAFGLWGIWLGWLTMERKRLLYAVLGGLCFGAAYLCKPEGVGFLLVFLVLLAGFIIYERIRKRKTVSWIALPACIFSFLIIASIYLVYLKSEGGYWTLSAKGAANQQFHKTFFTPEDDDIYRDLNDGNTSIPMDEIFHAGTFLKASRQTPSVDIPMSYMLRKYATNLFRTLKYGLPTMLTLFGAILLGIGLFGLPWKKEALWPSLYLLSFIGFYWLVVIPMFTILERYLQSMLPAAMVWMGAGLMVFNNWSLALFSHNTFLRKRAGVCSAALTGLLVAGLIFIPELAKITSHIASSLSPDDPPYESKEAGLWIKEHSVHASPVIMSFNKGVDYYAGSHDIRAAVTFPLDSTDRVLEYARNKEVDYFVVEERYLTTFPNLRAWVEDQVPERLKLIYDTPGPGGLHAWVFTWKESE